MASSGEVAVEKRLSHPRRGIGDQIAIGNAWLACIIVEKTDIFWGADGHRHTSDCRPAPGGGALIFLGFFPFCKRSLRRVCTPYALLVARRFGTSPRTVTPLHKWEKVPSAPIERNGFHPDEEHLPRQIVAGGELLCRRVSISGRRALDCELGDQFGSYLARRDGLPFALSNTALAQAPLGRGAITRIDLTRCHLFGKAANLPPHLRELKTSSKQGKRSLHTRGNTTSK